MTMPLLPGACRFPAHTSTRALALALAVVATVLAGCGE
jgi:hypothetical protein